MSSIPDNSTVTDDSSNHRDIALAHGGGGQLTDELLRKIILPRLGNDVLSQLTDSALLPPSWQDRLALTIDGYVVTPWRFPGGDIGRLAVCGTVNDLAVSGARPLALALSLIVAEGFPQRDLEAVLDSVAATAEEAGVRVVTGDTKVVGRHQGDGVYITTSGIGLCPPSRRLGLDRIREGDVILVNGPVGEHGLAVMLAREMPHVHSVLRSDVMPLNHLIDMCAQQLGDDLLFMRDPTRAGLAGVVADLAQQTQLHVTLEEFSIPVRPEAEHAADMLGLDVLEVANEGKVVMVVRADAANKALDALRGAGCEQAAIIGCINSKHDGVCELHTTIGGRRVIAKPYGEQLPRIC